MNHLIKVLKNPHLFFIDIMVLTSKLWPAELYIKCFFFLYQRKWLNLKKPQSFNEKLNWLKLHDHNSLYTLMADKYEVKKYVAERIGEDKIVPLLGVWDSFDNINFEELPSQFVLKCTHDSGSFAICKDKATFDVAKAQKVLEKGLKRNFYWGKREWVYKNIKPRIIAEKYIDSLGSMDSYEYKLTCFNGECKIFTLCTGIAHSAFEKRTNDNYDRDFNHLPWYAYYKNSTKSVQIPPEAKLMIEYAEKLSKGIPQVRVDFYLVDNKIYFGEFTFYTWAGVIDFTPSEWDNIMGSWLDLPLLDEKH